MQQQEPAIPNLLKPRRQSNSLRKNIDQSIYPIYNTMRNQPSKIIPSVDNKLALKFVRKIYSDYRISDPMIQGHIFRTQGSRKRSSVSGSNKKAKNLKDSFKSELMSSPTKQTPKGEISKRQYSFYYDKEISPCFRYCFICQQQILEANIDYHQREQCPQFKQLYSLELEQIKQKLIQKITKIRKQVIYDLTMLKTMKENNYFKKVEERVSQFLTVVDHSVKNQTNKGREHIKSSFQTLNNEFNNCFIKISQHTYKLQWFGIMYMDLCSLLNQKNIPPIRKPRNLLRL